MPSRHGEIRDTAGRSAGPASVDQLTGLPLATYHGPSGRDAPVFLPVREAHWLARLPADAVFVAFNIRDFGMLNKQRGYDFGDRLLVEIGRRLRVAADPWPVFRLGGNEFLVTARMQGEPQIRLFSEALRSEVGRPFEGAVAETRVVAARAIAAEAPEHLLLRLRTALDLMPDVGLMGPVLIEAGADGREAVLRAAIAAQNAGTCQAAELHRRRASVVTGQVVPEPDRLRADH